MGESGGITDREIDLEIVSNSWLALSEADGFDQLIASYARKIDGVFDDAVPDKSNHGSFGESGLNVGKRLGGGLIDKVVARQLEPIQRLLSGPNDFQAVDPLEHEAQSSSSPIMILSPDGTVTSSGKGAEAFFGISVGQPAGTAWLDERSEADYQAIRRSAQNRSNAHYAILRIISGGASGGASDGASGGAEALAEAYTLEVPSYAARFTVIRSLEFDWTASVGEKLEHAFGLTPAEIDICRLLFKLRDLDLVSQARGVTRETGRTQLKRIFAKTEIHSKADLIRLLAMLCSREAEEDDPTDLAWSDPTGREVLITRPDGRKLAYSWMGAQNGRRALFIHGRLPLFYQSPATQAQLAAANVKLICLSMPGHGSSDPAPAGVLQQHDGMEAIRDIVAHLGGAPMPVVAAYSGMTYPLFWGATPNDPFCAMVIIGLPWTITPETFRQLPPMQKALSQLGAYSPRLFDLVIRLGQRMLIREGPDFYLNRALGDSPVDAAVIADANTQPYLRAAVRHLVAQGHSAFVKETVSIDAGETQDAVANIAVPLHWLVPESEPTCTPEICQKVRNMNPHVTVETVADAGELLPYQRPDIFVRCMADLVSDDPAAAFAEYDY